MLIATTVKCLIRISRHLMRAYKVDEASQPEVYCESILITSPTNYHNQTAAAPPACFSLIAGVTLNSRRPPSPLKGAHGPKRHSILKKKLLSSGTEFTSIEQKCNILQVISPQMWQLPSFSCLWCISHSFQLASWLVTYFLSYGDHSHSLYSMEEQHHHDLVTGPSPFSTYLFGNNVSAKSGAQAETRELSAGSTVFIFSLRLIYTDGSPCPPYEKQRVVDRWLGGNTLPPRCLF